MLFLVTACVLCVVPCVLCIVLCYRVVVQAGEDLHVWGTGSPLRQFIYNVDLGALMASLLTHVLLVPCIRPYGLVRTISATFIRSV